MGQHGRSLNSADRRLQHRSRRPANYVDLSWLLFPVLGYHGSKSCCCQVVAFLLTRHSTAGDFTSDYRKSSDVWKQPAAR